jgi:hypothetical protein
MYAFFLISTLVLNTAIASGPFANLSDKDFHNLCQNAYNLNEKNNIPEAYKLFADQGDKYAMAAEKIFDTNRVTMERCVIQAHWLNVVGPKMKDKYFNAYGSYYQKSYIIFVCSKKRLPDSAEIENLYGQALYDMRLPDALSIDKVLNRQERTSRFREFQHVGTMGLKQNRNIGNEWYDSIELNQERVSRFQHKAEVSEDEANNLAIETTLLTIPACFALKTKQEFQKITSAVNGILQHVINIVIPPKPNCHVN